MDIAGLPKTELHLHLEGAIAHEILLDLVHKYGDEKIVPDLETLKTRLKQSEFAKFVEAWIWKNHYLREYEDFRLIARSLSRELAAKGIRYAEVSFSPGDFQRQGLHLQPLAKAIREGFDDASRDSDNGSQIKINLIVDLVRDCGPTLGARWLDETAEIARETGIVAIGLGGLELEFPPEPYAPVFHRAEKLGFHRVAHAGEAAGASSIWGALKSLGVERVGHGTRCFEDPALVEHLHRNRIPLEVCLTSNVCTGVVDTLRSHPFPSYFQSGIPITLSSDDPAMFDTDVVAEYEKARTEFGLTDTELIFIARTGFEVAFVSEEDRVALLKEFDSKVQTLHAKSEVNPNA
jgi:adenosine deaminase